MWAMHFACHLDAVQECHDCSNYVSTCLIFLLFWLLLHFHLDLYDIGDGLITWPQKPHVTSQSRDRLARATCRGRCVTIFIFDSRAEPSPLWATTFWDLLLFSLRSFLAHCLWRRWLHMFLFSSLRFDSIRFSLFRFYSVYVSASTSLYKKDLYDY
jgi:hypothetical protein